ncbi:MAG: hypothetical protein K8F91_00400, partial [Candidatus Obscuribacterales bacterium]|nr:hypothetical protein [Candidatus Obscuribacterales bacterium]
PNEMSLAGRIFTARSLKDPKVLRWQQLSTVGRSETFKRLCETVWIPANDFGIRQQKKLDSLVFLPNGELLRKMKDGSTRKTRWSLEGLISNFGTKINSSIGLLEHDEQRILDGVSYASLSVSREKENHLLDLESLGTYQRDSKLARSRGLVCPDTQYIDVTFSYPRPIVFNRPVRFDVELKYPASDPQVGKMASLDLLTVETMNDRDAIKSLYNWSTKKFGTYEASTSRVPLSMVSIWPVRKLRGNFEVSFDRAKPTLVSLYLPARARLGEDSYSKVDWCARFALTP